MAVTNFFYFMEENNAKSKVAIIGYGVVGKALHALFPEALIFDIVGDHNSKEEINEQCKIAFICVPTPMADDGVCDLSAVESSVEWLETPIIVIKSTVPPGTTDRLAEKTGKKILFNPEFLRAATAKEDTLAEKDIIIGGDSELADQLAEAYRQAYDHEIAIHKVATPEAELVKNMRNAFLSTKVTFINEAKAIADAAKIDFNTVRDLWLLDDRMGHSHHEVTERGGFDGMCLPKDFNSYIKFAESVGYNPEFLKATWNANTKYCEEFKDAHKYE
tara:strand:- start:62 stop:886 length:825 start_codon:yes stop_codon:yes gene_type:complete